MLRSTLCNLEAALHNRVVLAVPLEQITHPFAPDARPASSQRHTFRGHGRPSESNTEVTLRRAQWQHLSHDACVAKQMVHVTFEAGVAAATIQCHQPSAAAVGKVQQRVLACSGIIKLAGQVAQPIMICNGVSRKLVA